MASRATQTNTGIDPQIAELLGLDFTADLDREDYISLLKERMMAGRMSSSKLSSEETELITDEFKRVKRDTRKTFKVKKTKITSDTFKKKTSSLRAGANQKSLPGTGRGGALTVRKTKIDPAALVKSGGEEKEQSILEKILASVNSILGTLREDQKSKKKIADQERRTSERKKRIGKEDKLESGIFKGLAKSAKKILKPVEGILSRILKFIGTILIGKVLIAIVDWMSDKENEKKLNAIGRFLKDTWPALLAGFLLFGSGLTGFITGLLLSVAGFTLKLGVALTRLALAHPLAAALILGTGAAAYSALKNEETREEENKKDDKNIVTPTETREKGKTPSGSQLMDETTRQRGFGGMFNSGGTVPGSGPNKDTIPAMLTPGEFVMSRGAVQQYGTDTLESMNSMGGGTNRPMIRGGVTYANSGGSAGHKEKPANSSNEDKLSQGLDTKKAMSMLSSRYGVDKQEVKKQQITGGGSQSKKPVEYKDILDLIAKVESGRAGYDSVNPGTSVPGLSKMTIADARRAAIAKGKASGGSGAMGRYQQMPGFVLDRARQIGLNPDTALFNKQNQDKLGILLINQDGYQSWKKGKMSVEDFAYNLAGTWRGLPEGPSNLTYQDQYASGNKAHAKWNDVIGVLKGSKSAGSVATGRGVDLGSSYSTASKSNSFREGDTSDSGSSFSGLEMFAKIINAQNKFVSSKATSPSASLGSKPSPSAPPAPPTKVAPTVSVVNSGESSAQQTPISETGSYVPSVPSPPISTAKMATIGVA
jgi:hypothetical protein